MTIQSPRPHAYAEKERLIFRALCAYTAIALDNSVAYTHLRDAKDQLVAQEKLAALGALVAGVDIITRGLETAAELVQSFKQVAVDRATEQRRPYDLLHTTHDIVATLHRSISKAGHRLEIDIPESITLDGYPGPFGQIISNFVNNGLLHAFEGRRGGTMRLSARLQKTQHV